MDDFGFDFGGDFDFGGEAGADWWAEDPFAEQGFGEDQGPMGFGEMSEEQAQQAIADVIAEQEALTGEVSPLREALGDETFGQGQGELPTDVQPTDVAPVELTPNQRVEDAFFDIPNQPTVETPYPGGTTEEMLRGAFREQAAQQQILQDIGAQRLAEQVGPKAPEPPGTGIPERLPEIRVTPPVAQAGPSFDERFNDAFMPRQEMEARAPSVSQQASRAAEAMRPTDETAERGRSETLAPPPVRSGRSLYPPGTSPETIKAINEVAARHGLSPKAIAGVIKTESNWNPRTMSPGRGTYRGLTQIGPENPEYRDIFKMSPAEQVRTYGRWLDRYSFQDKMRNAGIDLSRTSPERQAAILQGFQFAPNATKWQMGVGRGEFSGRTTPHPQARALGDTSVGQMERYYSRMFGGTGEPSFSTAMPSVEAVQTMLASGGPLPELATDILPTDIPDQQRLAESFDALRGSQLAMNDPLRMAFGPEDATNVDPSTLPPPGARITVRPQRGETTGEPGTTPNVLDNPQFEPSPVEPTSPFSNQPLPEILVTPSPPTEGAPGEGGPAEQPGGTAQPGTGQYDTDALPSESPGETRERLDREREQRRRAGEPPGQQPPQQPIGQPRDPGDFNYPITGEPVRPQSVLRTDVRPEAERVQADIRQLLEQAAMPEPAPRRGPIVVPIGQQPMSPEEALRAAQGPISDVYGRGLARSAEQTASDIGHLINETILNRALGEDPTRTQEDRLRAIMTVPTLLGGVGASAALGMGRGALTQGISRLAAGADVISPINPGDIVKAQTEVAKLLPSGGVRPGRITADEIMSTFSSLNPVSSAAAAARKDSRPNAATRRKIERNARLLELRQRGMTLNERDEEVPLPAEEVNASPDARRALEAGVPMHIIRNLGPRQDTGANTSALALMAGTAALVSVPYIFHKFRNTVLPALPKFTRAPHDVPLDKLGRIQVPPGVKDYTAPLDIVRATAIDANTAAIKAVERIGAPAEAIEELTRIGNLQTRGQSVALIENAIHNGEMKTLFGDFKVDVSLSELAKRIGPRTADYNRYQIALNTIDDIKNLSKPGEPVATVRTMDLARATQVRKQLEALHPDFPRLNGYYKQNLREAYKFANLGEDATISRSEMKELTQVRPNEIPMTDRDRRGIEYVNHDSVLRTLADHMRDVMGKRFDNSFNGPLTRIANRVGGGLLDGPLSKEEHARRLAENPGLKNHWVMVPNRGREQYWYGARTLIDSMKFDPYGFSAHWGTFLPSTTRAFQAGTTGTVFAPFFASTNMMVTWAQMKFTTPGWGTAPSALNTIAAVPRQLDAQMAKYISESLNANSDHWFRKVFGEALTNKLSNTMAETYRTSWYRLIQQHGGTSGGIAHMPITDIKEARDKWDVLFNPGLIPPEQRGWMMMMKDGWSGLWGSLHSAPEFAGAVKSMTGSRGMLADMFRAKTPMHPKEAILNARIAASDTRLRGNRPLEYEGPGRAEAMVGAHAAETLRVNSPWFDAIMQGQRRIANAWMNNPAEFTQKLWLYTVAPQAGSYFWNMHLGKDPNGVSYNDYQMNMRSEDAKLMKTYWGIPGRPVEQGIDLRFLPHELTIAGRLTLAAIHQMYGDPLFTGREEFGSAAESYIRNAFTPAAPAWMNVAFATGGMRNYGGPFSPELVRQRQDPYDDIGNMASNMELGVRATLGALGDIVGAGAASLVYPEQTVYERLTNSMHSMARKAIEKDAIVSNVTGIRAPQSGITQLSTWVFDRNKEMNNLVAHQSRATNRISVKPASVAGGRMMESLSPQGDPPIGTYASDEPKYGAPPAPIIDARRAALEAGEPDKFPVMGARVRPPNNPLFHAFVDPLRQLTKTDGAGYKSAWQEHAFASKQLATLRRVPHASATLWQQELQKDPHALAHLRKYNIDSTDPKAVTNFYIKQQDASRRKIRGIILGFEEDMTRRAKADPILAAHMQARGLSRLTIRDMRPYIEQLDTPEVPGSDPPYIGID